MTTFAILHGTGDGGWAWHLVGEALRERGHRAVAPDLPTDRDDATWLDVVAAVEDAVGEADDVVVVGHSSGGFVAPLVAARLGGRLQIFVVGMAPAPGETAAAWFENLGWSETVADLARQDGGLTGSQDPAVSFYADVPAELAAEATARERPASDRLGETPLPLDALPDVPAGYVVTTRDRFIPAPVQRRAAAERLGITAPDEIDAGHCPHLARPEELAHLLVEIAARP